MRTADLRRWTWVALPVAVTYSLICTILGSNVSEVISNPAAALVSLMFLFLLVIQGVPLAFVAELTYSLTQKAIRDRNSFNTPDGKRTFIHGSTSGVLVGIAAALYLWLLPINDRQDFHLIVGPSAVISVAAAWGAAVLAFRVNPTTASRG